MSSPTAILFGILYTIELPETEKITEAQSSEYLFLRKVGEKAKVTN